MTATPPVRVLLLPGLVALGACTPLGAWLYDDPSFALSAVALREFETGPDSVELRITGCNRNDFELMGVGFEAQLNVDGRVVGSGRHENAYQLGTRDSTSFTVVLPVASVEELTPPENGKSPYELIGTTTVKTPIGDRRVGLRQEGEVRRGADGLQWRSRNVVACRPGQSTLPGSWDTRTTLPGPEAIPDVPPNQPRPGVPVGGGGKP
ncbi:MAG TPA: hypothetical protein VLA95_10615 [Gemmatimonadales bacterium]|nr:hypothetical protein [Gemmatimonadales bacterium]